MTLRTPGGSPASASSSASMKASTGVSGDGLSTIVQPATIAGSTFCTLIAKGMFHGETAATTPTGSRVTRALVVEERRRLLKGYDGTKSRYASIARSVLSVWIVRDCL